MDAFRLHHIGIAVGDIERAAAIYVSRLRYAIRSEVIHDPVQSAHVQFLALPGDSTLLELVTPDGATSKLAAAVKNGGGLNHVCYETTDIDEACNAMRAQGMFLIHAPVPAVAFGGRRIAWLMGADRVLTELVERPPGTDPQAL